MKMMKNTITTPNILTMSQRLEVMPLKYLSSSTCAASTFVMASSTLSSILYVREGRGRDEGIGGDGEERGEEGRGGDSERRGGDGEERGGEGVVRGEERRGGDGEERRGGDGEERGRDGEERGEEEGMVRRGGRRGDGEERGEEGRGWRGEGKGW